MITVPCKVEVTIALEESSLEEEEARGCTGAGLHGMGGEGGGERTASSFWSSLKGIERAGDLGPAVRGVFQVETLSLSVLICMEQGPGVRREDTQHPPIGACLALPPMLQLGSMAWHGLVLLKA